MRTLALAAACLLQACAAADVVTDWNGLLLDIVRASRLSPPVATRGLAMMHVAMSDAVAGCTGEYDTYCVDGQPAAGASAEAAAAQAGHDVLEVLYPAYKTSVDLSLQASLASVPEGSARRNGTVWGSNCARTVLMLRIGDGWNDIAGYVPRGGIGYWVPTPPLYAAALLPNWPLVKCWCMPRGDAFRGSGPPSMDSAEYTAAYAEVRDYGRSEGSVRTLDQTEIALFWDDGAGSATPPGHWNEIAAAVALQQANTLPQNARLFALLNLALADASIVAWDDKYAYEHWRPVTAIRQAYLDGNPGTAPDTSWTSLIGTPPFPEYVSGHSTFSGCSSRMLARFFGRDDVPFVAASDFRPGSIRYYRGFSQAAEEAGQSRIYGGIHFQYSNRDGLKAGRMLADYVFEHFVRLAGDVNGNGQCDAIDVQVVVNGVLAAGSDERCDVNKDGALNALDVQQVVNRLLGVRP